MRHATGSHRVDGVFVLLVFSVFAVCVLMVLLSGAGSYRRLTERDTESYSRRTAVQYVAAKVRSADAQDRIYVGAFSGTAASDGDTLHLLENIDGTLYDTRIYYCDGYLRELFAQAGASFEPEDGNPVLAAEGLGFQYDARHHLLTVSAADSAGSVTEMTLSLRSGEETGT